MKSKRQILYISLLTISLLSCKKDPEPWFSRGNNGWEYDNGDGDIKNYHDVIVDFDIDDNLNVDGIATITNNITIGNDLNLNYGGKVIIDTYYTTDTIYIDGNMNLNDSLILLRGFVILNGDLNINNGGILNIGDSAKVCVKEDINNSGQIYGERNIISACYKNFHKNGGSSTKSTPLFNQR